MSGEDGADDEDAASEHGSAHEDPDREQENLAELRKRAGLPDIHDDGLPSASAQKMLTLCMQHHVNINQFQGYRWSVLLVRVFWKCRCWLLALRRHIPGTA